MITFIAILAAVVAGFMCLVYRLGCEALIIWCEKNQAIPTKEQLHDCLDLARNAFLKKFRVDSE